METNGWHSHFQLDIEELQVFYGEQLNQHSLLYWCLKDHKLDAQKYLQWAQSEYGLPILKSDFTQDNPPSLHLWQKLKNQGGWTSECLPIGSWEDIVYVGVLEPQRQSFPFRVQYVLCHPQTLNQVWSIYNAIPAEEFGPLTEKESKEGDDDFVPENSIRVNNPVTQIRGQYDMGEFTETPKPTTEAPKDLDKISEIYFTEIHKQFEQAFLFRYEEGRLSAWKWDEFWSSKTDASQFAINLKTPSVFQIVSKTKKPYHGYFVTNEVNEHFFNNWNSGVLPDHITICPLLAEDQLLGMVLATGTKEIDLKSSLRYLEQLSNHLTEDLNQFLQADAA